MNTPEDTRGNDQEHRDAQLSERYRELESDAIPPALDAAVLALAQEEIDNTNRSRRWRKWAPPFALAASAILAVSILFYSGGERATLNTPPVASHEGVASMADKRAEDQVSATNTAKSTQLELQPMMAPRAVGPRAENEPVVPLERSAATSPLPTESMSAPAQPNRDQKVLQASQAAPVAKLKSEAEERTRIARPAQFANANTAAAAAPPAAAPSAPAVAGELKKTAGELDAAGAAQQWLQDIRKLRADGKIEEANRQWQEFRKAFPDYAVPDTDAARPKP
jgi:hypothetical protein